MCSTRLCSTSTARSSTASRCIFARYQWVLHEEGIEFSAREYDEDFVGLSDAAVFTRITERHRGVTDDAWVAAVTTRKTERVRALLRSNSPLFPGAAEHVRLLAERWPLALASGALRPEIEQVLESAGLRDVFVAVVAAGETPRSKPAPDPYLRALDRLSAHAGRPLDPAAVVGVEDTVQGPACPACRRSPPSCRDDDAAGNGSARGRAHRV